MQPGSGDPHHLRSHAAPQRMHRQRRVCRPFRSTVRRHPSSGSSTVLTRLQWEKKTRRKESNKRLTRRRLIRAKTISCRAQGSSGCSTRARSFAPAISAGLQKRRKWNCREGITSPAPDISQDARLPRPPRPLYGLHAAAEAEAESSSPEAEGREGGEGCDRKGHALKGSGDASILEEPDIVNRPA